MKKYIFLLLTMATLLGCRKNGEDEQKHYACCGAPFKYFYLKVDKSLVKEDFSAKFSISQVTNAGNKAVQLGILSKEMKDDTAIFRFPVIEDFNNRSLVERSDVYLLEIPNKDLIRITVTGQFVEVPNCCNKPQINKVLLNGELWKAQEENEEYNMYVLPFRN